MKKFLLKFSIFILSAYFLALILQFFIDKSLKRSGAFSYQEWNDIFDSKINADVLIMGASRADHHYSPAILDTALQKNTYNLGLEGYEFNTQYYRFLLYLKYNKKPGYIIQDIDCATFSTGLLFQYEQFLPYLSNDIIKQIVADYNFFDFKDFYIPLYKYTHNNTTKDVIRVGMKAMLFDTTYRNNKYKGFQTKNGKWNTHYDLLKKDHPYGFRETVSTSKNKFDKYLALCRKENIQVFLVYSPQYAGYQNLIINQDSILTIIKSYAVKYNIPFLDYSRDTLCYDTGKFWDFDHLNKIGVKKFNEKLCADLKKIIKPEPVTP